MSDALTPQLALAYLAELQPALTGVSIFDHEGSLLAGEDGEGAPISAGAGTITATTARHSISANPDPGAGILEGLARLDLATLLTDLEQVPA
jgi:hypothetical protein